MRPTDVLSLTQLRHVTPRPPSYLVVAAGLEGHAARLRGHGCQEGHCRGSEEEEAEDTHGLLCALGRGSGVNQQGEPG